MNNWGRISTFCLILLTANFSFADQCGVSEAPHDFDGSIYLDISRVAQGEYEKDFTIMNEPDNLGFSCMDSALALASDDDEDE